MLSITGQCWHHWQAHITKSALDLKHWWHLVHIQLIDTTEWFHLSSLFEKKNYRETTKQNLSNQCHSLCYRAFSSRESGETPEFFICLLNTFLHHNLWPPQLFLHWHSSSQKTALKAYYPLSQIWLAKCSCDEIMRASTLTVSLRCRTSMMGSS